MIAPGAILIKNGTLLPVPVANNLDGQQLEKALATAGWTYFYMAGTVRRISFGLDKRKMVNAALKGVLASVSLQNCNCLAIDEIAMHSFLGMPYASVAGHSRHIQEGMVLLSGKAGSN